MNCECYACRLARSQRSADRLVRTTRRRSVMRDLWADRYVLCSLIASCVAIVSVLWVLAP